MIKINDRWFLGSDSMQFILYEKTISKKNGKEVYNPRALCGNLFQLKNWLINKELLDNIELLGNIDKCIELSNTIDKTLTGVGKGKI